MRDVQSEYAIPPHESNCSERQSSSSAKSNHQIWPTSFAPLDRVLIERGHRAIAEGRPRIAEILARQLLRADPESVNGMDLLASAFAQLGRTTSAIEVRQQIQMRVLDPRNLYELGALFREIGQADSELRYLNESISECDAVIDGLSDPEFLSQSEQRLKSIRSLKFECLKAIGNLYVRKGDWDSAEEFYNRAHRIDPDSDVLIVNKATLELSRDRLDEARTLFRVALQLNPKSAKAWVGLALVHRAFGDHELSHGNLNQALDIEPGNRTAIRLLIEWAARDGLIRLAVERAESYLRQDPEDVEIAFSLAKLKVLIGELAEAFFECERVLAFDHQFEEAIRLRRVLAEQLVNETPE